MASSTSRISFHPKALNGTTSEHLIYFITGNPGLIGYYDTFLTTLHDLLSNTFASSSDIFHIHGQSLAGFEDDHTSSSRSTPYSLEEQISSSLTSLQSLTIPSGPHKSQPYTSIVLIGHSVGSYMLLEIVQRLKKSSSSLHIKAGILLFPTVTHIAKSPSGVKFQTLARIPNFAQLAASTAKTLVNLTPRAILKWLVGIVAKMPDDAAEVTTRFLKSRMGVWQALRMAQDEMETITEDRWDGDIWGIEHDDDDEQKYEIPKLVFYFGQNDHWVADHTRDALIAARGRENNKSSNKPVMLIDENGVDHGFCIRHSESIAEKVSVWIEEIFNKAT